MGRAHGTRRCAKRICCRSGNGGFAACSGRKSTFFFFLSSYLFINSSFFFYFCVSASGLNTTRPTFFSFWKRGGRLPPYSCSEKRPGYVANAPGALLWNYFMERSGGRSLRSFTVCTYHGYIYKATMAYLQCLCCTIIHQVHLPHNMHINRCVAVAVQERLWTLTLRRTFPLPLLCLDWPSFDEGSQEDIHLILRFRYILSVSHMSTVYQ